MSSYHGWSHGWKDDGGTDPLPLAPQWCAANGLIYTSGGEDIPWNLLWTGVWLDENSNSWNATHQAHNVFDIVTTANGAIDGSGEDAFGIRLLKGGIYAFTLHAATSDLTAAQDHDIFIALTMADTSTPVTPNYFDLATGNNSIYMEAQDTVQTGNSGQWATTLTIVTPISDFTASFLETAKINFSYTNAGVDNAWNFRIYIVRFGPTFWNAVDMEFPTYGIDSPIG